MRLLCHCFVGLFCAIVVEASSLKVPPPHDAADLKFGDLLATPAGPRGLSLSDTAKNLDGKRVRIVGYMVRQENTVSNRFLLTPLPVQLHDEHYGLADDLPATTIFVSTRGHKSGFVQYSPGLLVTTGVLRVGNHEEADGRISTFRIELDAPPKAERVVKSAGHRKLFNFWKRENASQQDKPPRQ
jgi:hypothetical protein